MNDSTRFLFKAVPNEEAMAFIRNKPVVTRDVMDHLLPSLRARAFTVSGIECANTLQRLRDKIAELPGGADWNKIKADIVSDISPYLVDPEADPETQAAQVAASERRADLLLRTHGFEAYQAASYEVMDRQRDVFPFWQYMTMEDEAVRDTHAALDGLILPADSSFWEDHYPPWDWGCRCQVAPLMEEEKQAVEESQSSKSEEQGYGRVLSDIQQQRLEQEGTLDLGNGHQVNVSSPTASGKEGAFSWNPGDLRIPIDELEQRYEPAIWQTFRAWATAQKIDDEGLTVWGWLHQEEDLKQVIKAAPAGPAAPVKAALPGKAAAVVKEAPGSNAMVQPSLPETKPERESPVSKALDLQYLKGNLAETVKHALATIDKVHDDGKLPQIPVLRTQSRSYVGQYASRRSTGQPIGIEVKNTGPWPALTTCHEIGHFIDHVAFGNGPEFGSDLGVLKAWKTAVDKSSVLQQINFAKLPDDLVKYYSSDKELWARSYAQYIAEKSGDQRLLTDLANVRNSPAPWRQWSTEEFAPIKEAMDSIFKKEGWL